MHIVIILACISIWYRERSFPVPKWYSGPVFRAWHHKPSTSFRLKDCYKQLHVHLFWNQNVTNDVWTDINGCKKLSAQVDLRQMKEVEKSWAFRSTLNRQHRGYGNVKAKWSKFSDTTGVCNFCLVLLLVMFAVEEKKSQPCCFLFCFFFISMAL